MVIVVWLSAAVFAASVHGYKEQMFNYIVIQQGDTLWDISLKYKDDNQEVRKYIYDLKRINNLTDSTLFLGDVLKIPVR